VHCFESLSAVLLAPPTTDRLHHAVHLYMSLYCQLRKADVCTALMQAVSSFLASKSLVRG
jgi:hypothetical protein